MYPQTPPVIKPHLLLSWDGGGTADTLKEEEPLQDADRLALRISSGFKSLCPLKAAEPQSVFVGQEGALPCLAFEGERMSRIQAFVGCWGLLPPPLGHQRRHPLLWL